MLLSQSISFIYSQWMSLELEISFVLIYAVRPYKFCQSQVNNNYGGKKKLKRNNHKNA